MGGESGLGNAVKERREARGWSQAELARRAGLSRAGVSAVETGRLVPSTAAALALAACLDCRVEELFWLGPRGGDRGADWAWDPPAAACRYWLAEVGGRTRRYPVEVSALGLLPHDGRAEADGTAGGRTAGADPGRTLLVACCDPAAGLLADELARAEGFRLIVLSRSSRSALELAARGLVHAAGVHLGRADDGGANPAAVAGLDGLPAGRLLRIADWDEGIALAPGRKIATVRQALASPLRWVGREPGSGARQCLDEILGPGGGGRPSRPVGEASDHRGVASAIRQGWADAGVCLRLVGEEAGLDFLSVRREAFELFVPDRLADDPRLVALVRVVRSAAYRKLLRDLPGYGVEHTGEVRPVGPGS